MTTQSTADMAALPVLVLQGGGALGAYQAGAFARLAAHGVAPRWIAGVSIGAINAALIAGNPPDRRVERLTEFWELVTSHQVLPAPRPGSSVRPWFDMWQAWSGAAFGVPGFFAPRIPPPVQVLGGAPVTAPGYCDTTPLRTTLLRLVDFDYLNHSPIRLSLGAVEVASGNSVYFDSRERRIGPEHVMASGALPPGFPAVEIDGTHYWDGGLVSNSPLQYVLDAHDDGRALLVFQVDLFSASGRLPGTMAEVSGREKDIRYSSRTRLNTTRARELVLLRHAAARLLARLPPAQRQTREADALAAHASEGAITVLHLIRRPSVSEADVKDFDFSRASMTEHWVAGATDVDTAFIDTGWQHPSHRRDGIAVFDLTHHRLDSAMLDR